MSKVAVIRTLATTWLACLAASTAQAQESCQPIEIAPGQTLELSGTAPANDAVCFALTGLSGRHVSVSVSQGTNIIFSIDGIVDAQERYGFTAAQDNYRIVVGQLMRSIEAEPFRILVAAQ